MLEGIVLLVSVFVIILEIFWTIIKGMGAVYEGKEEDRKDSFWLFLYHLVVVVYVIVVMVVMVRVLK